MLRIRELGPKTINEAESHTIRLEAHRLTERQRGNSLHQSAQHGSSVTVCQTLKQAVPDKKEEIDIKTLNESIRALNSTSKQLIETLKGCLVSVFDDVIIPPNNEIIVPGKRIDPVIQDTTALMEQTPNFMYKHELLLAKTVVNPTLGTVPLRILNITDMGYKLHKNTVVATNDVVKLCTKQKHTVNEVKVTESCLGENTVPEHLNLLFQESCKELSETEHGVLKDLLMEYQDTFSRSTNDMG
ncbi:hypothetical protein CHS0354_009247 [Potamilus streckersoni]|uniref:Uncharacterized protein n=1 Tax=Potamilus streckersoni TaxID=2493646 RepID=A0AAE0SJA4_9BIVA|nr:hypothetical protein CHS0354_009247 [Potamilus streckersoni]